MAVSDYNYDKVRARSVQCNSLTVDDDISLGDNLAITGLLTVGETAAVTGNTTVGGTLGVTGATTLAAASTTGLTVGATGTSLAKVIVGTVTVANGNTSVAGTVTGAASGDLVFATLGAGNTNGVSLEDVQVTDTDEVTVVVTGDPGADLTVNILVIDPTA